MLLGGFLDGVLSELQRVVQNCACDRFLCCEAYQGPGTIVTIERLGLIRDAQQIHVTECASSIVKRAEQPLMLGDYIVAFASALASRRLQHVRAPRKRRNPAPRVLSSIVESIHIL